jgi:hypothetical protein
MCLCLRMKDSFLGMLDVNFCPFLDQRRVLRLCKERVRRCPIDAGQLQMRRR